jgi:hypothetical protein
VPLLGDSIEFVLGFRVGPPTNRLVGDKGTGKKRGQTGGSKNGLGQGKGLGPRAKERFQNLSKFPRSRFK